jgi:hypothetical protein
LLERNEPARPTARESVIPGTHNDSTVRSTTAHGNSPTTEFSHLGKGKSPEP